MSRENLEGLLRRLGASVGIDALGLDEEGCCALQVDGDLVSIEFDEESQSAILTTACGPLPEAAREAALQAIADANFHWAGTGGGTLSTNSREAVVYLQYREPTIHLEGPRFELLLQALLHNAERWRKRLQALPSGRGGEDMFIGGVRA